MKKTWHLAGIAALGLAALATLAASKARAQDPILTPVIVDTAVPIIVNAIKPTPKPSGLVKFEGFVMNANTAQVTVRAKGNDMAIRSFALSQPAATRMQAIIDRAATSMATRLPCTTIPSRSKP